MQVFILDMYQGVKALSLKKKDKKKISRGLKNSLKFRSKVYATKEKVSDFLELPKEVMLKSTKITTIENTSVLIEGYQKIIDYYDNYIKIKANNIDIVIDGENLDIVEITDIELVIEGKIYSLNYQK